MRGVTLSVDVFLKLYKCIHLLDPVLKNSRLGETQCVKRSDLLMATTWSWSRSLELTYPNRNRIGPGVDAKSYTEFNISSSSYQYRCTTDVALDISRTDAERSMHSIFAQYFRLTSQFLIELHWQPYALCHFHPLGSCTLDFYCYGTGLLAYYRCWEWTGSLHCTVFQPQGVDTQKEKNYKVVERHHLNVGWLHSHVDLTRRGI